MRRFFFVLCTLTLIVLGGVLMANRPPDNRPPRGPVQPPVPAVQQGPVTITHKIFATINGQETAGEVLRVVVTDLTKEGDYAVMTATGLAAPDVVPSAVTTFTYVDVLLPGVVSSEIDATAIALPKGAWLTCETFDENGDLIDVLDVEQLFGDFREISVQCVFVRAG